MNSDDFEQRLQRQPLRPIPPEWRADVLSAMRLASDKRHASRIPHHVSPWRSVFSTLNSQLSTLLWPSPKAWAALATIWVVIFAINAATADKSHVVARMPSRRAREMILTWKEHERLLTELIGPPEMPIAERPKPVLPRPRSERRNEFLLT